MWYIDKMMWWWDRVMQLLYYKIDQIHLFYDYSMVTKVISFFKLQDNGLIEKEMNNGRMWG